jgi:hypothetical protein
MADESWLDQYDLDADARRALQLEAGRDPSPEERRWLAEYKREHDHPLLGQGWVGRGKDEDIGVFMGGWDEWGDHRWVFERGNGNVNVAGGWFFRIGTAHDERGWHLGWAAQLSGLAAFFEAMGFDAPADCDGVLGLFPDEEGGQSMAYFALAKRMLAALILSSRAAVMTNPERRDPVEAGGGVARPTRRPCARPRREHRRG